MMSGEGGIRTHEAASAAHAISSPLGLVTARIALSAWMRN
jgi:hypothetical protein